MDTLRLEERKVTLTCGHQKYIKVAESYVIPENVTTWCARDGQYVSIDTRPQPGLSLEDGR